MALKEDVQELRSLLATVLVDPSKTTSNNRLVDLLERIAEKADALDTQAADFETRIAALEAAP